MLDIASALEYRKGIELQIILIAYKSITVHDPRKKSGVVIHGDLRAVSTPSFLSNPYFQQFPTTGQRPYKRE